MKKHTPVLLPSGLDHVYGIGDTSEYHADAPQGGRQPLFIPGMYEPEDILRCAETRRAALLPAQGAPAFHGLTPCLTYDSL
nr:hypothetical protein [Bacteroides gallinarum]